jgi:hypothetical protein
MATGLQQSVKIMATSYGDGSMNSPLFYRKLKPGEITNGTSEDIYKMELPMPGVAGNLCHFWLVKKGLSQKEFNKRMIEDYLFPAMMQHRQDRRPLNKKDEPLDKKLDRMAVIIDGEDGCHDAWIDFIETAAFKDSMMTVVKGSPNCTGVWGGNALDNCPMFKNIKANLKTAGKQRHLHEAYEAVLKADDAIDSDSFGFNNLETDFQKSFLCCRFRDECKRLGLVLNHSVDLQRFFFRMEDILMTACTPKKMRIGWQLGGYFPYNPAIPLSACKGFLDMTHDERRHFIAVKLPQMVLQMSKEGENQDAWMEEKLQLSAGSFGTGTHVTVPFDQKIKLTQRRANHLSSPTQIARYV